MIKINRNNGHKAIFKKNQINTNSSYYFMKAAANSVKK